MTRLELEIRRVKSIPLIEEWQRPSDLARQLNVSRTSLYRWKKQMEKGGKLLATRAHGRPHRLSPERVQLCKQLWEEGERRGFHWTQAAFAKAIETATGISFNNDHVGRLIHRWGLR